jgi:hypothetical protein
VPDQTLDLAPDEVLHVLVPPPLAAAVAAVSPRVRAHAVDPADGPPRRPSCPACSRTPTSWCSSSR